ncbi:endolytic transglycosylase MltG [Nonomuraea dietziae]|uniref:endolytic transglycosylase MltG n=1 Tax=Nonomuraea dietziae TaxID=65515 RepID=UPI0033DA0CD1
MNIEELLRETLSDMARQEEPPPPGRFLRAGTSRSPRWGLALAAAAVTVMVVATTLVVEGLSTRRAAPGGLTGQGTGEWLADTGQGRRPLTVQEGQRLSQILDQLSRVTGKPLKEFVRAAKDGDALGLPAYAKGAPEGFLFPSTYEVSPRSGPHELLAAMVARFNRAAEDTGLVEGARRMGRTPLEIVTVASIVQAESARERDMPKIARVIYNRLDATPRMRLQLDSTVMYGLGKYGARASDKDLTSRSRYNTYTHLGLPPGSIGSPGEDAIRAALHPATGPWLYFVTTDPRRAVTKFAASEREFFELVEEHRKNLRSR